MSYILQNKKSKKPLSYFYSGDISSRKAVIGNRKNSYFIFDTAIKAQEQIQYIRNEVERRQYDYPNRDIFIDILKYINNLEIVFIK